MTSRQANTSEAAATSAVIRRALLVILVFGSVGTGAELLLLEHTEDFWQRTPLFLMAGGLLVLGWYGATRQVASLRAFQATMVLFVLNGGVGVVLHYRGNVEFELEMHPGTGGLDLFREAMMGATPALAPGTMILLGLLGLVYTFRHPVLDEPASRESGITEE
jgi:hypothetical protein